MGGNRVRIAPYSEPVAPSGFKIETTRMHLRSLLATILLAAGSTAQGADQNEHFAIKGIGLQTCADYVRARKEQTPQYFQFGGWMEGYISATNRYEKATFDLVPWQSSGVLATWLQTFCERNPNAEFVRAVGALVTALGEDRLQARSEVLNFDIDGKVHYVYADVLRRAQEKLAARGMYQGPADGTLNADTQEALKRFQGERDLKPTGMPEQATLALLLQ